MSILLATTDWRIKLRRETTERNSELVVRDGRVGVGLDLLVESDGAAGLAGPVDGLDDALDGERLVDRVAFGGLARRHGLEECDLLLSVGVVGTRLDLGRREVVCAALTRLVEFEVAAGLVEARAGLGAPDEELLSRRAVSRPRDLQRDRLAAGTADQRRRGVVDVEVVGALVVAPHVDVGVLLVRAELRAG